MKIEKLTENKIRIILNQSELLKQNIDLHSIAKNNDKVKLLLKNILLEAEKQVGFKVNDSKLLIEAFSSNEDIVVFTLTKYQSSSSFSNNSKKLTYKRKITSTSYDNAIYKFDNFDEFCKFCIYCNNCRLKDLKAFSKKISLYLYEKNYYLCFSNINQDYTYLNLFYSSISEFSTLVSDSLTFKSKLDEFGKIIFNNAIKNGIKYFANL